MKSAATNVSVVIFYQPNGGKESPYPQEGTLAADEQQATINRQFDIDVTYSVWLKVYEGQLVGSSQKTTSVEAHVEKTGKRVTLLYSMSVYFFIYFMIYSSLFSSVSVITSYVAPVLVSKSSTSPSIAVIASTVAAVVVVYDL